MPLSEDLHGAITPNRRVSVRWDVSQSVLVEPATILRRDSASIYPSSITNLTRLQSGCFVLNPENDLSIVRESATAHQYILRLENDYIYAPIWYEVPRQRALSELSGIAAGAGVASSGDWFITKRIRGGDSWDQPLDPVEAGPTIGSPMYPLDPAARAPKTGIFEHNQGFLVRLVIPGAPLGNADNLFSLRFGGELSSDGYGKYEMVLSGSGHIVVFEKIAGAWVQVRRWGICDYQDLANSAIAIRIIPHWPRFIEFKTFAGNGIDSNIRQVQDASLENNFQAAAGGGTLGSFAYEVSRPPVVARIGGGPGLRPITGAGGIQVSVRRDLRLYWQVARIAYKETGTMVDRAFVIPAGVGTLAISRFKYLGYQSQVDSTVLASISGELERVDGTALTPATENFLLNGVSYSYSGWEIPGGQNKLRATITLTNHQSAGSRFQTPSLWGYEVHRQATIQTLAPGEKTGGERRHLSITGPSYRPDHETASMTIEDPEEDLTAVRRRKTPVLIETTFDAADQTKKAVLFRGQTARITAAHRGMHDRVHPHENWKRLDCDLVGMWDRLATNRFLWQQLNLADESSSPIDQNGQANRPWRVTDALFYLLYSAGFPATQIDIPASDIRFFVVPNDSAEDSLVIQAGTPLADLIVDFARLYLNGFILWDGGAGSAGMWRLRYPPTGSETALWSFTLQKAAAGKLQHLSASYGANISPVLDVDGAEYHTFTVPPEVNVVSVISRAKSIPEGGRQVFWNQRINWRSWSAPGHTALADQTSPDWLGYISPHEVRDDTLPSQEAVDFVCNRKYSQAAFGRVYHQFAAELVLVNVSGSDSKYTARTHRPLRVGDPVNFIDMDGVATKCVVHSANFSIEKDQNQLAYYELEEFRAGMGIGGR